MNVRALFTCLILFAMGALGFSSFTSCRANGGSLISCGLVGFLIGAFKAAFFASVWLIVVLFDGVAHLFCRWMMARPAAPVRLYSTRRAGVTEPKGLGRWGNDPSRKDSECPD